MVVTAAAMMSRRCWSQPVSSRALRYLVCQGGELRDGGGKVRVGGGEKEGRERKEMSGREVRVG